MTDLLELPTDHRWLALHRPSVGGDSSRNTATLATAPTQPPSCCEPPAVDQKSVESQIVHVDGTISNQPTQAPMTQDRIGWLELRIWAEMHHDAQLQRIATVNRAERGGVDPGLYLPYIEVVGRAENVARLGMVRCYRRVVPAAIRAWQKEEKGVGEHLLARLLGHLGHPSIATPHHWQGTGAQRVLIADEPYERSVSQLWQYCGHGDPTRRKAKGMTADDLARLGNPSLKMIVHLLAEACMKQQPGNLYRDIYENRRIDTSDRTHVADCVRCGPSGKPALIGTPWSKAHQHADALRIVGKELLRDLWLISQATP